ncbi:tetratricopeptide repeat protein [Desulfobacula toluolica]|uniref:tetratricopeptide repeat protein n=1 Tax=Desulfobacula toluolica TaxID=28223 RepID=UPI00130E7536|nr:tetratricopeptide repeat protein [Desulfobacula toluolica]
MLYAAGKAELAAGNKTAAKKMFLKITDQSTVLEAIQKCLTYDMYELAYELAEPVLASYDWPIDFISVLVYTAKLAEKLDIIIPAMKTRIETLDKKNQFQWWFDLAYNLPESKLIMREELYKKCLTFSLSKDQLYRIYNNLGSLMNSSGEYTDAETWYRKAMKTCPTKSKPCTNLIKVLHRQNKHNEIRTVYARLMECDNVNNVYIRDAVKWHYRQGLLNDFIILMTEKLKWQKQGASGILLTVEYSTWLPEKEQEELLELVINSAPTKKDHVKALQIKGNLLFKQADYAKAETCYQQAYELDPENEETGRVLINFYTNVKNWKLADQVIISLEEKFPKARGLIRTSLNSWKARDNLTQGYRNLHKRLENIADPKVRGAIISASLSIAISEKLFFEAEKLLDLAKKEERPSFLQTDYHRKRCELLLKKGKFHEAALLMAEYLKKEKDETSLMLLMKILLKDVGNLPKALKWTEKALIGDVGYCYFDQIFDLWKTDPINWRIFTGLLKSLSSKVRTTDLLDLAGTCKSKGLLQICRILCKEYEKRNPLPFLEHNERTLAGYWLDIGDIDKANYYYQSIFKRNRFELRDRTNLINILLKQNKVDEAKRLLTEQLPAINGVNLLSIQALAETCAENGKFIEFADILEELASFPIDSVDIFYSLTTIAENSNCLELALQWYEKASRYCPGDKIQQANIAINSAYLHSRLYRQKEAYKILKTIWKAQPENTFVGRHYALILLSWGEIDKAGKIVQDMLQTAPTDPYVLNTLGHLELHSGNTKRASDLFKQVLSKAIDENFLMNAMCIASSVKQQQHILNRVEHQYGKTTTFITQQTVHKCLQGRYKEAIEDLKKVQTKDVNTVYFIQLIKKLANKQKDKSLIETEHELLQKEGDIDFFQGVHLYHSGKYDEALDIFSSMVDHHRCLMGKYKYLGSCLNIQGNYEKAEKIALEYIKKDSSQLPIMLRICIISQIMKENYSNAEKYLSKLKKWEPGFESKILEVVILENTNRKQEAELLRKQIKKQGIKITTNLLETLFLWPPALCKQYFGENKLQRAGVENNHLSVSGQKKIWGNGDGGSMWCRSADPDKLDEFKKHVTADAVFKKVLNERTIVVKLDDDDSESFPVGLLS